VAEVSDRRIAEWLAILTFAVYAYSFAGGGWNQNSQFDLTRAIVERHTFAIDAYAGNTGDVSYANGHVYSNKSPALSWIAAIPYFGLYAIEHARGIDVSAAMPLTFNAYMCSLITVALPGALIPAMLFLAGRKRGFAASWCAFVALAIAFATQLFPYATIFMLHVPSGALLLFALTSPRRGLAGFAAGLATAMNYLCAPAIILFAMITRDGLKPIPTSRGGPHSSQEAIEAESAPNSSQARVQAKRGDGLQPVPRLQIGRFLAGAVIPLILLAIYQQLCFGSFLTNSMTRTDPRFITHGAKLGVLQAPSLNVFYAITISPYRGIFYFAPLLIAALGGLVVWWRSRRDRAELFAIVAIAAFFFGFNLCFNGWDGGFGIPGRYLVPVIPLAGLALLHFRGWLTIALAILSFTINFAAAVVDPQPSATIPRPLTQYIAPLLFTGHFSNDVPITAPWSAATLTGHTSVNRMTFDESRIFQKHPPGSTEAEWTSFNLGEPMTGAGSAASIVPLLLILAGGCSAIAMKTRKR